MYNRFSVKRMSKFTKTFATNYSAHKTGTTVQMTSAVEGAVESRSRFSDSIDQDRTRNPAVIGSWITQVIRT